MSRTNARPLLIMTCVTSSPQEEAMRRCQYTINRQAVHRYAGQPLHSEDEVYRGQAKSGTTHFHAYATAYVVHKGQRFTVALTGDKRAEPLAEVLQRLLRQAARAGVQPRYLLLDKGFCSVA